MQDAVNTQGYWEERFSSRDWNKYDGGGQSAYFSQLAVNAFPEWLRRDLSRHGYSVTDWGCAQGDGTALLARVFPACGLTGVDFSAAAVEQAAAAYPYCSFEQGDIHHIHRESDVVFCSNTLEHLRDPRTVLEGLVASARRHAIILVPLHEENPHPEHFCVFNEDFFPLVLGEHRLSAFRILDCTRQYSPYWSGEQLMLVYTRTDVLGDDGGSLADLFSNDEYEALKALLRQEEAAHTSTRVQFEQLSQEHGALQREHGTLQREHGALQQEHGTLRQVYDTLQQEHGTLQQQHGTLQQQHGTLQQEHSALQQEHGALQQVYDTLQQEHTTLQQGHETLLHENSTLREENNAFEQLREQLVDKLGEARQEHDRAMMQIREQEQRAQELEAISNSLQGDLHAARATSAALTAANDTATRHLENLIRSPLYQLAHFISRLRRQGFSRSREERRAFRRWFRGHLRGEAGRDNHYNPLYIPYSVLRDVPAPVTAPAPPAEPEREQSVFLDHLYRWGNALDADTVLQPYTKMDVIVLSIIDYDFRHQRPQHFAQRFARLGHRVFYVNTNFAAAYGEKELDENLTQVVFSNEQAFSIHVCDWRGQEELLQSNLERLIRGRCIRDAVVVVDYPNWLPAAHFLKERYGFRVVCDYMDDFTGFINPAADMVRENCIELLGISDGVAASSLFLQEIACRHNKNVALIRNGAEYEYFHSCCDLPSAERKRPVIGYYGAIAEWFNADVVCRCARRFPQCDVVLVGAVTAHREQLEACENIRLVGEVPYTELLPYLASFDVCLIPFDTSTDLIKATNPVKFYEYLSAGKKIVATEIPELLPYKDRFAYLENDPERFCEKVGACLDGSDCLAGAEECFAFAAENDWDVRARQFMDMALGTFPMVSVIVLCYNQLDYTRPCVDSILQNTAYPNYELIMVDNASSDGTADYLRQLASREERVRLVLNDSNRGFAGGNNDGLAIARGEYLLLLNNDTVVTRGWLTNMVKHFRDWRVGLVGPLTNSIGNEARIPVDYKDMDAMHRFAFDYTQRHMGEEYPHRGVLAMFCLMISRAAYESIGPLDENYGIGMFEDDDYTMAAWRKGFEAIMAEDTFIHHCGSVSFNVLEDEYRMGIFNANRRYFENKWHCSWRMHQLREELL